MAGRVGDGGPTEIEAILDAITQHFRDAGYFLSRAVVEPQDPSLGVLRIKIVEGFVESVVFAAEGEPGHRFNTYTQPILDQRPLTRAVFERQLLLMSDLPGVDVEADLRPIDEAAGAYALDLVVARDDIDGAAFVDNRGTHSVGPLESWVSVGVNDALGGNERLMARFFTVPHQPRELLYFELGYGQPLGSEGIVASVSTTGSFSDAGGNLAQFNTKSRSIGLSARISHPFIRRRDQSLSVFGAIDLTNSRERRNGALFFKDRLRVARLGLDYARSDDWRGTTYVSAVAAQGLSILGASNRGDPFLSRANGRVTFFKVAGEITREQAISDEIGLAISATAQHAAEPLLSAEEFAVGGSRYGRGYDFSELKGDSGAAGSIELRYGHDVDAGPLDTFQFYAFYDIGTVWNELTGGGSTRQALASAGGGVRLVINETTFFNLEIAKPLTLTPANEGDRSPRLFFTLSSSF